MRGSECNENKLLQITKYSCAILFPIINWLLILSLQRADSLLVVKREKVVLDSPQESQKAKQGGIMSAQGFVLNDPC